ncbi:MAG: NAD(P)-dependent oxidoreductase, partial [Huintestinicola sp.]
GMKVIASTRTPKTAEGVSFVSTEEVFMCADFISLHCPLTEETRGLVNMDTLRLCKPSAYIINTSRGPVVNETDLANALGSGIIAGAGLDVVEVEPMKADNPLLGAKNCIITPHVAWAPVQTRERLIAAAVDNLRSFIDGTPKNKVN